MPACSPTKPGRTRSVTRCFVTSATARYATSCAHARPRVRRASRGTARRPTHSPCIGVLPVRLETPVARRIPLPRLTQRQRMARWQRERRQQTLIVTVFSAILFFTLGLVAWAATSRYYSDNLKPSLTVAGRSFAMRDFTRPLGHALTQFY